MNHYFITGTSSGIGRALVEVLIENNDNRIAGYSRRNFIQHPHFCHQEIDLSNVASLSAFAFPEIEAANRIVLINNAGTLGDVKHLGNLSNEDILQSYHVNVAAPTILSNEFVKRYQNAAVEKVIINVSSGAATSAYDGWATYSSSKAAINMLTEVLVKEQQDMKHPIQAYAIAPGVVDTYMQQVIRESNEKDFSRIQKFHDLKESGELYSPEEVARAMIAMIENPKSIPSTISRLAL